MIVVIIVVLIAIFVIAILQRIRNVRENKSILKNNYGKLSNRELKEERIQHIRAYFDEMPQKLSVDDVTYNDLDLIEVFRAVDNSISGVGSEYLYSALRNIGVDEKKLKSRDKIIDYFDKNKDKRIHTQLKLLNIGKFKKSSIFGNILSIRSYEKVSNIKEYILLLIFISTICLSFYNIKFANFIFISGTVNAIFYFIRIKKVKNYLMIFKLIINLVNSLNHIYNKNKEILADYESEIKEINKKFSKLKYLNQLINESNGDILSIILAYLYALVHIDIISANYMAKIILRDLETVINAYEIIGEIELAINVASFRRATGKYCKPEFLEEKVIDVHDCCHPLINDAVENTITTNKNILLTGSNASGKSTFLKTIAINAILAQTIYTVIASKYRACKFNIMSSMAIRDNLFNNESYYIVEIKSLKRIVQGNKDVPILCFIDEILRGTNTIERISASKVILEQLSEDNCICFAATHDIELTKLLEGKYLNYHFEEHIEGNDISFDYKLKEGRSMTRNAIKLLSIIGFSEDIINKANKEVEKFEA